MIRVLELFGGIGACSKALKRLGIDYEIMDYVEIDKYAVASFNAMHGANFEPQDIRDWDKDIKVDLIMHGSPCQDFSIAGRQAGGDEGSGTRSSLMYETLRIVEKVKPKYVIWENVKNLLSKKHRHNFDDYLKHMESLGYQNYYQVLNAKDYGVPQNRERVFTISILGGGDFKFPAKQPLTKKLKDILEENVDERYFVKKTNNIVFGENRVHWDNSGKGYGSQQDRAYYQDGVCPALSSSNNGDKSQVVLFDKNMKPNTMHRVDITQKVKVRKYEVDVEKLKKTLREHKNYTNQEIANYLEVPATKVEHWFRQDKHFAIPDPEIWFKLKDLLKIDTDEFDKSIMEFEEKDNVYEKFNRCYLDSGIAPTLTHQSRNEKVIVEDFYASREPRIYEETAPTLRSERTGLKVAEPLKIRTANRKGYDEAVDGDGVDLAYPESNIRRGRVGHGVSKTITTGDLMGVVENYRIRKLTPKECWRLMGFDDEDFEKAEKVCSNAQLYKQAGNSIVVNVLEAIFRNLLLVFQEVTKPIQEKEVAKVEEIKTATINTDYDVAAALEAFKQAKHGAEEIGCKLVGEFEYRGKNITIRLQAS